VVNTASISAIKAGNTVGYASAKAGLVAMTRVAAVEFGRQGVRVNAILPGATMTPMAREVGAKMAAQGLIQPGRLNAMSLLGRMAEPEEMAKLALFLASDEASFVTGQPFVNDGGWSVMTGIERADGRYHLLEGW
jgi:NAD(P)-dependent dehydrogenase (short-subunit alcohol dehydrogenase family)